VVLEVQQSRFDVGEAGEVVVGQTLRWMTEK
jgi:hypothetical protein